MEFELHEFSPRGGKDSQSLKAQFRCGQGRSGSYVRLLNNFETTLRAKSELNKI